LALWLRWHWHAGCQVVSRARIEVDVIDQVPVDLRHESCVFTKIGQTHKCGRLVLSDSN
jgi:hypothetical protein